MQAGPRVPGALLELSRQERSIDINCKNTNKCFPALPAHFLPPIVPVYHHYTASIAIFEVLTFLPAVYAALSLHVLCCCWSANWGRSQLLRGEPLSLVCLVLAPPVQYSSNLFASRSISRIRHRHSEAKAKIGSSLLLKSYLN